MCRARRVTRWCSHPFRVSIEGRVFENVVVAAHILPLFS
jgi:hypothetical protein